jgi:hypothetical protein
MPELGVPDRVPSATAALIAGVPAARFRAQYVETGLVAAFQSRGRVMVDTASLEHIIGREISCQMYCRAERQRDGARDYQRHYRDASHVGA